VRLPHVQLVGRVGRLVHDQGLQCPGSLAHHARRLYRTGLVKPNNFRNVAEVRHRHETLRRNSAHDYESSSLPKRKRRLIQSLAKFIAGTEPRSKAPSVISAARVLMASAH
jgi:hypothetical protein